MEKQNDMLLRVKDLRVFYTAGGEIINAVNGVDLEVRRGETLGLVGETGAGKTTIAKSIMRILPDPPAKIGGGEIYLDGQELLRLPEKKMREIRGKKISMIFQDPMTALNPVFTVGEQIEEVIMLHEKVNKGEAAVKAQQMLELVGIPGDRSGDYPHQFSGGMKQRVVIAIALACEPELLIADEPTTALDVTIQAQILSLMNDIRERLGTSMLMITHDLGIIAETCDDVAVMYAGQIVEYGTVEDIFSPGRHHPYTTGLFEAIPNLTAKARRLKPIDGMMPDPADLPAGCKFAERCSHCTDRCRAEEPGIFTENGHRIKCFLFQGKVQQSVLAPDGK